MPETSCALVLLLGCLLAPSGAAPAGDEDAVVFAGDGTENEVITPPVLPVIAHLENDPSTGVRDALRTGDPQTPDDDPANRFGFGGFDVSPNAQGGLTASFSHAFTGIAGGTHAGSHSVSVGHTGKGLQVSHSSSQSSNFNGPGLFGNSLKGSHSSSHSGSLTAGLEGISSANSGSSSSSLSGNVFGQGFSASNSQSHSAAGGLGGNGISGAFGQGSGHAASLPDGQTFAGGHSSSNSFGNGASASGSGGGFAQNINGVPSSGANSQSSASVQNGYQSPVSLLPEEPFYQTGAGTGSAAESSGGDDSAISFPGPATNRYPKVSSWRLPYRRQGRRKPSEYQIIRVEV